MGIQQITYRLLILVIGLFTLSACGDNSSNSQPATTTSVTELPSAVLTLPAGGTLRAYISIDGGARTELQISANSVTAQIPDLARSTHTVMIAFEFTDSSNNTVTVATAEKTVDLSSGDASISFVDADYDMASYDDDSDNISNAAEYKAGTDPLSSECVVGFSLIGSCTL